MEGKITIFNSIAISRIVHLAIIVKVPDTEIEKLKQIQKYFLWGSQKVKTKQNILHKDSGLKSVDLEHKTAGLRYS